MESDSEVKELKTKIKELENTLKIKEKMIHMTMDDLVDKKKIINQQTDENNYLTELYFDLRKKMEAMDLIHKAKVKEQQQEYTKLKEKLNEKNNELNSLSQKLALLNTESENNNKRMKYIDQCLKLYINKQILDPLK